MTAESPTPKVPDPDVERYRALLWSPARTARTDPATWDPDDRAIRRVRARVKRTITEAGRAVPYRHIYRRTSNTKHGLPYSDRDILPDIIADMYADGTIRADIDMTTGTWLWNHN